MKKAMILVFLAISIMASSQNLMYRCNKAEGRFLTEDKWSEWEKINTNIIIRYNANDDRLEFNNSTDLKFYFDELIEESVDTDEDNDEYKFTAWEGFDDKGNKCILLITDWTHLTNTNFSLHYKDTELIFYSNILK